MAGLAANRVAFRRGVDAPTPTLTPTPTPTSTPTPTLTPGPTSVPSPTPIAAPTPTPAFVQLSSRLPVPTMGPQLHFATNVLVLVTLSLPNASLQAFSIPVPMRVLPNGVGRPVSGNRGEEGTQWFLSPDAAAERIQSQFASSGDVAHVRNALASLSISQYLLSDQVSASAPASLSGTRAASGSALSTSRVISGIFGLSLPPTAARVGDLSLLFWTEGNLFRFLTRADDVAGLRRDGTFAILNEDGETFLTAETPLDPTRSYCLILSVRDDGPFDADPTPGSILNAPIFWVGAEITPTALPSSARSGGGCALGLAAPEPSWGGRSSWPWLCRSCSGGGGRGA